ncbi:UNVERIFIED_CONTAM: hypothetical protein GTU68_066888 [Idotea baltica]|nr:hypothetical protein [Idotea baltica]
MNIRCFNLDGRDWWFGGGIDLTPIYIVPAEAKFFHQALKSVCDQHDDAYYAKFKDRADRYFYLRHRKETRGVGGIFYDHLGRGDSDLSVAAGFAFSADVGRSFIPIYLELVKKNRIRSYNDDQLYWQALRRSRYVEFNLLWDRGTKFGLDTDGRTESILMSMPPMAKWVYDHKTEPGSQEEKTQHLLKNPIDWVTN